MSQIGLFWGSETGATEEVSEKIEEQLGKDVVTRHDIADAEPEDFEPYQKIIIGVSTWYDGELQSSWEEFFPQLDEVDFSKKVVAFFGMGDQYSYSDNFIDGVGTLYDKVIERGATVVGKWSTEGYTHDESTADRDGSFMGLALDEHNQSDQTEERLEQWLEQIQKEWTDL